MEKITFNRQLNYELLERYAESNGLNKGDQVARQCFVLENILSESGIEGLGLTRPATEGVYKESNLAVDRLLWEMNAGGAIQSFSSIAGMSALLPDPQFLDGGLWYIDECSGPKLPGASTVHPETKLDRVLTAVLYIKGEQPLNCHFGADETHLSDNAVMLVPLAKSRQMSEISIASSGPAWFMIAHYYSKSD